MLLWLFYTCSSRPWGLDVWQAEPSGTCSLQAGPSPPILYLNRLHNLTRVPSRTLVLRRATRRQFDFFLHCLESPLGIGGFCARYRRPTSILKVTHWDKLGRAGVQRGCRRSYLIRDGGHGAVCRRSWGHRSVHEVLCLETSHDPSLTALDLNVQLPKAVEYDPFLVDGLVDFGFEETKMLSQLATVVARFEGLMAGVGLDVLSYETGGSTGLFLELDGEV